tara:strand:- start:1447 stop:1599 length:153 start_codon:yes stop_codon:yes gene_type:complete
MTPAYGFGMLAVGLVAIAIIGLSAWWIVNKRMEIKKEEDEREERNKIFGE